MFPSIFCRRICWFLASLLFIPWLSAAASQSVWSSAGAAKPQKRSSVQPSVAQAGEAPRPQLLDSGSNPALRYPVAVKDPSVSCGWLDVTRIGINYTVVESEVKSGGAARRKFAPGGAHFLATPVETGGSQGFALALLDIKYAGVQKGVMTMVTADQKRGVIYLGQENWGTVVAKPGTFERFAEADVPGTMAVLRAIQNFDSVLAEIKPPAPPALDVSLHAEPATVEKGRPVTLVWNSTNATTLDLEPGVGHVAAAGGVSVAPQESTNYTLTATGPAGSKVATVFVSVNHAESPPPVVVLTEPSALAGQTVEVASSPLTIHGVAMDASGIPVVSINGKMATMRPTSSQAAEFRSDPIALNPGENNFEVVAINSAHGQTKIAFIARLTSSPPKTSPAQVNNPAGLAKAEILSLLQGEVPSAHVAELVKQRGIRFAPTPDDLKEIRNAGGGDDLIDAITQASNAARN